MSENRNESIEQFYVCGRCGLEQEYLPGETRPETCRDCAWPHFEKRPDDIPSEIKLDLNKYK